MPGGEINRLAHAVDPQRRLATFGWGFMDESEARNIEVVRKYFEGCNSGDIDQLMSTIAHDVTHYFLSSSSSPIRGAAHLAEYWKSWKQDLDPVWAHDHLIARGDEVVAEWSVIFTPPGTQKRLMNRGTEWYVMRDSRILEVRAYFIADPECLYPPSGLGDRRLSDPKLPRWRLVALHRSCDVGSLKQLGRRWWQTTKRTWAIPMSRGGGSS